MIPNYRVVALDPGGTTGWAKYDAKYRTEHDSGKPILVEQNFEVGQLGPHEHHRDLYAALEHWHIHHFVVVTESFEFRQNDGNRMGIELISREYIGVTKLFGAERKVPVVLQTAGAAKKFVPDKGPDANKKLKAMGWYTPGMKHANDAARHLIYYLVNAERRFDLIESWKDLV